MARQTLDIGVSGDPTSGEKLRDALGKVNTMTAEIYPALGATGPAGPQGEPGNTLLVGTAAPTGTANPGDSYLDSATGDLYVYG